MRRGREHRLVTGPTAAGLNQDSGTKAGPEPLHTLATYRRTTGGVSFGVRFSVLRSGKLSVGDELTVSSWADSEL